VDLVRPTGRVGDERCPRAVLCDDARAGAAFGSEHVVVEVAARPELVLASRVERSTRARGDEGVGIDLPVRVLEGHADVGSPVLEAEHLLDSRDPRQDGSPVCPGVEHQPHVGRAQVHERRVVVR